LLSFWSIQKGCNDSDIDVIYGTMGRIIIRNLDDAVIETLRRRAAAAGTSTEEEARRALAASVGLERKAAAHRLAEVRRRIGRLEGPSVLSDLRRGRARDQG
jgi:plasmid stability protein